MTAADAFPTGGRLISVLFSEPKIPQCTPAPSDRAPPAHFSALQRAENSSMPTRGDLAGWLADFSALQRAENSSIERNAQKTFYSTADISVLFSEPKIPQSVIILTWALREFVFQCSSASRKFLNQTARGVLVYERNISVLFSEPKIPQ